MTDASGTPQATISYDGFGNVLSNSNSSFTDRYLYTGREFDSVTGLQYNRARYYDPTVGRWTQEDPLGFGAGDSDLYAYVSNDLTSYNDASGLVKIEVRYKSLGKILWWQWYHAYVVVTDTDGTQMYFRSGPSNGGPSGGSSGQTGSGTGGSSSGSSSGGSNSSGGSGNGTSPGSNKGGPGHYNGPWGPIQGTSGPYNKDTIDWETGDVPSITILDNDEPAAPYNGKLQKALDGISNANIPYNPFSQNSNSTAHQIIQDIGLPRPVPPDGVWAPGHGTSLPPPTTYTPPIPRRRPNSGRHF
jgi:RHS repeat-associated protein